MIGYAFEVPDYLLKGAPNWIGSQRFDIEAKTVEGASLDEIKAMLRRVLTERFDLRLHHETQQAPIYSLVMSGRDGKLGSQLRRSELNCDAEPSVSSPEPPRPGRCGFLGPAPDVAISSGRGRMAFRGLTIARLAQFLSGMVARNVTDRTGLVGYYDGEFDFTAEFGPPPPPPGVGDPYDRPVLPSIFSVLPEQLGLKLESGRGPVDMVVLDSISQLQER